MRDSLQDRLDEGMAGTLAVRLAVALQLAQILRAWHRMGKFHGSLTAEHVLVSGNDRVTLLEADSYAGPETEPADVRAFGIIFLELLRAPDDPLIARTGPPAGESIPLRVTALCDDIMDAKVTMKQVVAVLEKQVRGGHLRRTWLKETAVGLLGLLGLATAGFGLAWLSLP